ncbi:hypothetical protein AMTR_s00157p00046890 [Amborella trichopoda]|uniref:Uncharacterized protein n=1 Tax=Amborella trichopoda TaxID=13333 RepID=W1PIW7_AMBTC|nr:hypothetical protein AMTR_s00157p00046890 [Amborella trichopoda]
MVFKWVLFESFGDAMLSNRFKNAVEKHGNNHDCISGVERNFIRMSAAENFPDNDLEVFVNGATAKLVL